MTLKINTLISIMEANNIRLPLTGTGRGGAIVARDLEHAVGNYYLRSVHRTETELSHYALRRAWTPMKAYRFNSLNKTLQASIFEDDNDWYAERKLNGWRMMITFIPGTTPMFWGGNLSTVTCLPVDYTKHIMLSNLDGLFPATSTRFDDLCSTPHILDCEVLVEEDEQELSEHASLIRIQEILGSSPERARIMQNDSKLNFHVFDVIQPDKPKQRYIDRKNDLSLTVLANLHYNDLSQFSMVPHYVCNKKRLVNKIWKEGGEGIILKKGGAAYLPGSRLRTHQIKVKRVHSDMVGDDIDAFVSKIYNTPEWSKVCRIGGVELSVYLNDGTEHVIAKVTSIPDDIRAAITDEPDEWLNQVLVVDGQDLSSRNRRLLHAKVDWKRGIRKDKNPFDCVMHLDEIEGVKF